MRLQLLFGLHEVSNNMPPRPEVVFCWLILMSSVLGKDIIAHNKLSSDPSYIIHTGHTIVPGEPFIVLVTLFKSHRSQSSSRGSFLMGEQLPVTIECNLEFKGDVIASEYREANQGTTLAVNLSVPRKQFVLDEAVVFDLTLEGNLYGGVHGSLFYHETKISMTRQQPSTIIVETSQPVYKQGQTVRGRVLVLDNHGKPWNGALDVVLCNPNGDAAYRWTRLVTRHGVTFFQFPLVSKAPRGQWRLTASLRSLLQTATFSVESGQIGSFSLYIKTISDVITFDDVTYGKVLTWETERGFPVPGEFTLSGQLIPVKSHNHINVTSTEFFKKRIDSSGHLWWNLKLKEFYKSSDFEDDKGTKLLLTGKFVNYFDGDASFARASVLVAKKLTNIGFSFESGIMRYDIPFQLLFYVRRIDDAKFSQSELESSKVRIHLRSHGGRRIEIPARYAGFKGFKHIWKISIVLRDFEAEMGDQDMIQVEGQFLIHLSGRSIRDTISRTFPADWDTLAHHLSLTTSSSEVHVGENIIFHARSNYPLSDLHFIIVSSGRILSYRDLNAGSAKIHTFDVMSTNFMAPEAQAIIWHTSRDKTIVSATCDLDIRQILNKVKISNITLKSDKTLHFGAGMMDSGTILIQSQPFAKDMTLSMYKSENFESGLTRFSDAWKLSRSSQSKMLAVTSEKDLIAALARVPGASSVELLWGKFTAKKNTAIPIPVPVPAMEGSRNTKLVFYSKNLNKDGFSSPSKSILHMKNSLKVEIFLPKICKVGDQLILEIVGTWHENKDEIRIPIVIEKNRKFSYLDNYEQDDYLGREFSLRLPPKRIGRLSIPIRIRTKGKLIVRARIDFQGKMTFIQAQTKIQESLHNLNLTRPCVHTQFVQLIGNQYYAGHINNPCFQDRQISLKVIKGHIGPLIYKHQWEFQNNKEVNGVDAALGIIAVCLEKQYFNMFNPKHSYDYGHEDSFERFFQILISYKIKEGSFLFSPGKSSSYPSIWFTATALKALLSLQTHATRQYVDNSVLSSSLNWLIGRQDPEGYFDETLMFGQTSDELIPVEFRRIALTAHVTLALTAFDQQVTHWNVTDSLHKSCRYLARKLARLDRESNPLDSAAMLQLALVTRALQLNKKIQGGAETAFEIFAKNKREKDGFMFWGASDSRGIRATALGLMINADRREMLTAQIVSRLNSLSCYHDNDLLCQVSTLEALITWRKLQPELDSNNKMSIHVHNDNITSPFTSEVIESDPRIEVRQEGELKELKFKNPSPDIHFEIRGLGPMIIRLQAGARLVENISSINDTMTEEKSGIEKKIDLNAYLLKVSKEMLDIRICQRKRQGEVTSQFGPFILDMNMPTGYSIGGVSRKLIPYDTLLKQDRFQIVLPMLSSKYVCIDVVLRTGYRVIQAEPFINIRLWEMFSPESFNEVKVFLPSQNENLLNGGQIKQIQEALLTVSLSILILYIVC